MGYTSQQQCPVIVGLLDILGHLVEGPVHLGYLRRAAGVQQSYAVALADALGSALEHLQRPVELAHENPGGTGREHADQAQPADHQPDPVAAQGVGVERYLQPLIAIARLMDPDGRLIHGLDADLGTVTQLITQLIGEHPGIGPVDLPGWHQAFVYQLHAGNILEVGPGFRAAGPVGLHQHGGAVTVLAVDQQILVAHQVEQGEDLGEQGDQQYQQQGAGKETAGQQWVPAGAALHCCWPSGTKT